MPFSPGKSGNPEKQWKKGQSGNPKGRRNAAKDILNQILEVEINDRSRREQILSVLVTMAEEGDLNAIKEVLDRTEGKSKENIVTEELGPIHVLHFDDPVLDEETRSTEAPSEAAQDKDKE